MAILPRAFVETVGTKQYHKIVGTQDFATNTTSVGVPGTATTCCPTRLIPCCENGLATDYTTTAGGSGLGAGGGRSKGTLTIVITGLCGSDTYMGKYGNGMHKLCYNGGQKVTKKRVYTFKHPTNNGGVTTTGGIPNGNIDYSSCTISSYYYSKAYKAGTKELKYIKRNRAVNYDKKLVTAQYYPVFAPYTTIKNYAKKEVNYAYSSTMKQWGENPDNSAMGTKTWAQIYFNKMTFDWYQGYTLGTHAANGIYGYGYYCTNACTTRDIHVKRDVNRKKVIATTENPWIRGQRKDTLTQTLNTSISQNFQYDLLHPNGYIFQVCFQTSGYTQPDEGTVSYKNNLLLPCTTTTYATCPNYPTNNAVRINLWLDAEKAANGFWNVMTQNRIFVTNTNDKGIFNSISAQNGPTTNSCTTGCTTPTYGYGSPFAFPTYKRYTRTTTQTMNNFTFIPTGIRQPNATDWWEGGLNDLYGGTPFNF